MITTKTLTIVAATVVVLAFAPQALNTLKDTADYMENGSKADQYTKRKNFERELNEAKSASKNFSAIADYYSMGTAQMDALMVIGAAAVCPGHVRPYGWEDTFKQKFSSLANMERLMSRYGVEKLSRYAFESTRGNLLMEGRTKAEATAAACGDLRIVLN